MVGLSQRDGLAHVINRWYLSLINSQCQATVYRHNTTQPVCGHSAHCDPVVQNTKKEMIFNKFSKSCNNYLYVCTTIFVIQFRLVVVVHVHWPEKIFRPLTIFWTLSISLYLINFSNNVFRNFCTWKNVLFILEMCLELDLIPHTGAYCMVRSHNSHCMGKKTTQAMKSKSYTSAIRLFHIHDILW